MEKIYSSAEYMRRRVAEICCRLPQNFDTLTQWQQYKSRLITQLPKMLPLIKTERLQPDTVVASITIDGGCLQEVEICVDDGYFIRVHLYLPTCNGGKLPAVIVCPGYMQEKRAVDIARMSIALMNKGIAAMAMEYTGTGFCGERPDSVTDIDNVAALCALAGSNDVGLRVSHNMAALRYLKTLRNIDPKRIGITGLCQGSIALWYTAALCEDLAAIAPLCGTTTYEAIAAEYTRTQGGWSGISPYVYNLLSLCDVQHLYGCFAPRPLFVQNNIIDRHWPYSGFGKVQSFTEQIYGLYNAAENCRFSVSHEEHAYTPFFADSIAEWFTGVL